MTDEEHFSNTYLKRLIAFGFLFLGVVLGYFLGWRMIAEGKLKPGITFIIAGLYFITSVFWMFKSMKHLYIAVTIPFLILGVFYLIIILN